MRETEIIDYIRTLADTGHRNPDVIQSIGDDCAILRPRAKQDLVFTCDFVLEGRHFARETHSAADIGYKALARSLSDIAAMGGEPVFFLVSLAVPFESRSAWIGGFYRGLLACAATYNIVLAGGDLARFGKIAADVTCCARVPRGKALLRSGAKSGDAIYVTGELGGAALGLATRRGKAWRRHLRPEPRIEAGILLRRLGVSSAMDISDGLSSDLHRMCMASGAAADIDEKLPIAPGASIEQALHGGDDYELLFTAPKRLKVPERVVGVRVTRIGVITSGPPGLIRFQGARLLPGGYDHFDNAPPSQSGLARSRLRSRRRFD